MDFFKSILSDDPEPENMDDRGKSETNRRPNQGTERAEDEHVNLNSTSSGEVSSGGGGLWSFGDLVKTITTRSESVLETYRRDLKEFGSGLRKESDLFREVASRAVKELPTSIEVGASAIDGVLKSTAGIISQGKDALLEPSDESESVQSSRGYSRFDSQLDSIQSDARTYCEDPEDLDDYNKWKLGFVLTDMESETEKLIGDNGSVEAMYRKVVPNEVDDGSFWCRYFYRIHKLKLQEDVRANLVRRSLTVDDEEDLSWDVEDEEEEKEEEAVVTETEKKQSSNDESVTVNTNVTDDELEKNTDANEPKPSGGDVSDEKGKVELVLKPDQNVSAGKSDDVAEEDLEWDEIGDIGDNDEKEVPNRDTKEKGDVLKLLNTPEEDEDLNWDIEDDDEPLKASNRK